MGGAPSSDFHLPLRLLCGVNLTALLPQPSRAPGLALHCRPMPVALAQRDTQVIDRHLERHDRGAAETQAGGGRGNRALRTAAELEGYAGEFVNIGEEGVRGRRGRRLVLGEPGGNPVAESTSGGGGRNMRRLGGKAGEWVCDSFVSGALSCSPSRAVMCRILSRVIISRRCILGWFGGLPPRTSWRSSRPNPRGVVTAGRFIVLRGMPADHLQGG